MARVPYEVEKEKGEILTIALEGHEKAKGDELKRRKGGAWPWGGEPGSPAKCECMLFVNGRTLAWADACLVSV